MGRDAALAMAGSAMSGTVGGAGRLLLVTGEAGIGKTALARTVAEDATGGGARVLWASCPPGGGAPAFWPWTVVVRDLGAAVPGAREVAPLLSSDVPPADRDDASARFGMYDAVTRVLTDAGDNRPTVVVIDDLHWADLPSLDLLDFVARRLGGHRVLVLGTYREVEAPDLLHRIAAGVDGITLGGIDAAAVVDLVAAVTASRPTAAEAERLRVRTGGNPLFVRELARLLVGAPGGGPGRLPATITDTLGERLDRLSDTCRDLLRVVAAADSADLELLTRVVGADRGTIVEGLAEAERARVVDGVADRPFVHDLFREAVLAGQPEESRRAVRRAVAAALIELAADDARAVSPARIATHLAAALPDPPTLDPDEQRLAAQWAVRAAEAATARLGHEEAVRFYRQAIDLSAPAGPALMCALGDAQVRAGDPDAQATYLRAAAAARTVGDAAGLAAAALGLHRVGARGSHESQLALLDEALAAVAPGSIDQARVLAAIARDRRHDHGRVTDARTPAEHAVVVARAHPGHPVLAECLLALHDALWVPGSARERLATVEEMAAAATAAEDPELLAQATVLRAACLIELNDPRGLSDLRDYCRQQEDLGHARGRWEALTRRATLALVTGVPDEAHRYAEAAFDLGVRMGIPDARGVHGTLVWALTLFRGTRCSALELLLGIEEDTYRACFTAAANRADGDPEVARAVAATIRWPVARPGATDLEFAAAGAEALVAAGPTDDVRACYADLLPHAGTNVLVGGCASYWGPVDRFLGELAATLGDHAAAARHFDDAAQMAETLGAPLWRQHALERRAALGAPIAAAPRFTRDGEVWALAWQDRTAHLPDSKGVRDLAVLLTRPGQEVPATELMGIGPVAGADPVLDDVAKNAYRRRLADLEEEIADAEADHDDARAERARDEHSALVDQLAAAVGLGGRDRRLGDDAERARKAVTARIRDAIRRVGEVHPELGAHLATAVRTGSWCAYQPE